MVLQGIGKTFTTKKRSVKIINGNENNADEIFYNEIKNLMVELSL